ncbi:MAG: right-handed parallel beta-helix repeat-containing protein, partial [Planctomycetota bacterium]
ETGPDLGQLEPRIPVTDKTTPGGAIGLFEITRPGSYFLTGDLQMPGGDQRSAIAISTNDVTLDLNGFRLSGAGDSVHGIEVRGSRVRIRDGFIFRFGRDGINASPGSFNVSGIVVEDVMTQANNRSGIVVDHGRVARCRSIGNGGSGIVTGPSSVVESVESSSNLGAGVEMSTDGVLRDSTASLNKAAGFSFAVNGVAAGSHAANNAGSGFDFALGGSATDSTARGNGGRGFRVQDGEAAFESCVAEDNTLEGFLAAGPASIRDCDAIDNEGDGISVGDGSSIESSRARWNSLDGFRINGSASVVGCLATENFGDGYEFVEQFFFMTQRVETSVARNNSGVGVRAEGFGVI